jgi:osmotically-inducible protein OsmY
MSVKNHSHSYLAIAISMILGASVITAPLFAKPEDASMTTTTVSETTNDALLKSKIVGAYMLNDYLSAFDIKVKVEDEKVMLMGEVETDIEQELAAAIAKSIARNKAIDNQITVNADVEYNKESKNLMRAIKDSNITASVKMRLLWNSSVSGHNVKVVTNNQVVSLEGEVNTQDEKNVAENIAANTTDVIRVKNNLNVNKTGVSDKIKSGVAEVSGWFSDSAVTARLYKNVLLDKNLKHTDLSFNTNDSTATIEGTVQDNSQKEYLLHVVKNTEGVEDVIDHIKVEQ